MSWAAHKKSSGHRLSMPALTHPFIVCTWMKNIFLCAVKFRIFEYWILKNISSRAYWLSDTRKSQMQINDEFDKSMRITFKEINNSLNNIDHEILKKKRKIQMLCEMSLYVFFCQWNRSEKCFLKLNLKNGWC